MTPARAQRLQDEVRAAGRSLMWFVAASQGKARLWAVMAGPRGGIRLPDELVANTLAELREMLPSGLTRWQRISVMPPDVLEVCD